MLRFFTDLYIASHSPTEWRKTSRYHEPTLGEQFLCFDFEYANRMRELFEDARRIEMSLFPGRKVGNEHSKLGTVKGEIRFYRESKEFEERMMTIEFFEVTGDIYSVSIGKEVLYKAW